ncbi:MAG: hypothetical protein HN353_05975 [Bdellovibrionales bacterium]|jgi:hypothetical protein|nr:hypothetical protein [Bdellovibrionales bacterium]MBT7668722.1 hypothetical protein [Bdellovibrionales bacterium]
MMTSDFKFLTVIIVVLVGAALNPSSAEENLFDQLMEKESGLDLNYIELDSISWEPESKNNYPKVKRGYTPDDLRQLQMVPASHGILPGEYYALLKSGSVVTRLSDDKSFVAQKQWQVRAIHSSKERDIVFLLSKSGKVIYSTLASSLVTLEADRKLGPTPKKHITSYENDGRDYRADSELIVDGQIIGYRELMSLNYFNQVGSDNQNVGAWRLESNIFPRYSFPIAFGLNLGWQQGGLKNYSWNAFDLGATLKMPLSWSTRYPLTFLVTYQFSPLFIMESDDGISYRLTSNSWQFNLQVAISESFTLGAAYRISQLSFQDEPLQDNLSLLSERVAVHSFAINLGYNFNVTF